MLLAALTHVVIDRTVWPPDSKWEIFAACASAAAAIATAILALLTRTMAEKTAELAAQTRDQVRESKEAVDQAERHHRESLSPFLALQLEAFAYLAGPIKLGASYTIQNLGNGTAIDVVLTVALEGRVADIVGRHDAIAVGVPLNVNPLGTYATKPTPYHCLLSYANIFGERGWIAADSPNGTSDAMAILEHVRPGQGTEEKWAKVQEAFRFTNAPRFP